MELPEDFDVQAVIHQIQTLKNQRSNAMDDVAVLMGRLESKTKAYDELSKLYTEVLASIAQKKEVAEDQPGSGTEDKSTPA